MEHVSIKKVGHNQSCFYYCLIAFGLLGGELLLGAIEQRIYGVGLSDFSLIQSLIHWSLTSSLWLGGCLYLYRGAKKDGIQLFSKSGSLGSRSWLAIGLLVITAVLLTSYLWDWQLKPLVEWRSLMTRYGTGGNLAFLFQLGYYGVEGLVMVMIIGVGQALGESLTQINRVPWGSLALSLTWGLGHMLSKNLGTAIYCVVFSLLCGLVFLLVKKDAKLSLGVIILMFII